MPAMAVSASFNCKEATTPIEIAICNDAKLAKLDARLGKVYKSAIVKVKSSNFEEPLRQEQREWIRKRDQSFFLEHDIEFIKSLYRHRIEALKCPSYSVCQMEFHGVGAYRAKNEVEIPNGNGQREGDIDVHVTIKNKPLTLLLTAYEKVNWKIIKADDVVIRKIIAVGYYRPSISVNDSESARVIVISHRDENGVYKEAAASEIHKIFKRTSKFFNSFPGIGNKDELSYFYKDCKNSFGKELTSFQSIITPTKVEVDGVGKSLFTKEVSGSTQISVQVGDEPEMLLIIDNAGEPSSGLAN